MTLRCSACKRTYPDGQTFCPLDGNRLTPLGSGAFTDPLLGAVLDGRYRVEAQIGKGGCGTVYRARQINVDRDVAVKVLSAEAAADESMARRFENEARIISRLRHPNTLKLLDFGHCPDGRLYLVTEYLHGTPLDEELSAGPLSPRRAIQVLLAICKSLVEAHEQGIVHRDLKPANVFLVDVGAQQVVKVLDFGIAKLTEGSAFTAVGKVFGTPAYMSPEQARGESVDLRSDLYSLGVLGYACLSGAPPFSAPTPMSLLLKHIHEQPRNLVDLRPPLPVDPDLAALVMALLAKNPADRPPDALAVIAMLESLQVGRQDVPGIMTSGLAATVRLPASGLAATELMPAPLEADVVSAPVGEEPDSHERLPRSGLMAALIVAGVAIAGLIAWQFALSEPTPPPIVAQPVDASPAWTAPAPDMAHPAVPFDAAPPALDAAPRADVSVDGGASVVADVAPRPKPKRKWRARRPKRPKPAVARPADRPPEATIEVKPAPAARPSLGDLQPYEGVTPQ